MLTRRDFLRAAAGAALSATFPPAAGFSTQNGPLELDEALVASQGIALPFTPYEGSRYQASVPDTLDLAECAQLALNVLTRATRPDSNYDVWFYADFSCNPPTMSWPHQLAKFWEAAALLRLVTGSNVNLHVDQVWARQLGHAPPPTIETHALDGRELRTIAVQAVRMQDPIWRAYGDLVVRRASRLSFVHRGDICYWARVGEEMPTGSWATRHGWVLDGLAGYYRATGSEPALATARKVARYLKDYARVFDADARFIAPDEEHRNAIHFHSHGICLVGLAEYALASGEAEFGQFAQRGYEFARSLGTPLVGYFPEYVDVWPDDRARPDSEGCCVADMVTLALRLTEAGLGDYWDDVDRYVRNMLAMMQLRSVGWIYRMLAGRPPTPVKPYPEEEADQVPERNLGAFAGWSAPNDFSTGYGWIMQCCTGNCARTLYFVWKQMLVFRAGQLRVNLLLNRASPWADVDSYIPYQGRVELKIKQDCELELRLPEWVQPHQAAAMVNQQSRKLDFAGRYAQVGPVQQGDLVTLTFPIAERTVTEIIGKDARYSGERYTLILKGNDVVSIDPPGQFCPDYQRSHYRNNEPRRKPLTRFLSAQNLPW